MAKKRAVTKRGDAKKAADDPLVLSILLCDFAIQNGTKPTLVGVFDNLLVNSPQPPSPKNKILFQPFFLHFKIKASAKISSISVRLVAPSGDELQIAGTDEMELSPKGTYQGIIPVFGLAIDAVGMHHLRIFVNDTQAGPDYPLDVIYTKPTKNK